MNYKIEYLPIGNVKPNPNNPRLIKDAAFKRLAKSLKDCPELFAARPCICSDRDGQLIILGGNMRYLAAKELKYKEVPVIIMAGLTEAQEREITIKDNGDFGEWDFSELGNTWDDLPLVDWGVNIPESWNAPPVDKAPNLDPGEGRYKEQYGVIIICDDEATQEQTFNDLSGQGYNCKVVTT